MIEKIIGFSLGQRYMVIALLAVLAGMGIWSWTELKIEAYPDVGDTEVAVITKFPGRATEEVEQQITIPVERSLNSVPRVISRRSKTIFGLSIVRLTFSEGTDDYFARQQVLERLHDVDLPDGVAPELGPLSTPVGEILRYVIEGDRTVSSMELRELQDWVVVPELLKASGVADISNFGGLEKQYNVIIHPSELDRYHLTIQDVYDAIVSNNASTGGNIITFGSSQIAIRSMGRISGKEDIERIVLTVQSGTPVFVRDVASVEIGALPPSGVLGYSDLKKKLDVSDGVEGIVLMRRGENPSEVLQSVKQRIQELNDGELPKGIKIKIMYDREDLVDSTLHTVGHTLFEGISIVIIVLIFFLGNLRAAVSVALTIPLSLLFAFIAMKFTGIPANLLSLGAIDFGIIVDASVVMVESIARHLVHMEPGQEKKGILRQVMLAAGEVQRQIVFAVAIIILAYLPLFTLQRVEGKLFSPMAYTLSYAILGSLILALTAVPVFASFLFAKGFHEWHNPVLQRMEMFYENLVHRVIERPRRVILVAGSLVALALLVGSMLGTEFLPELDEGGFNIRCVLPAGISLQEAKKYPPIIRQQIGSFDEVKIIISQLGRNDDGTDPYGPNRIETLVQLKPYDTWKSGASKKELLFAIKHRLETAIPGASFSFSQPILDNVTEAVTGSAADLAVMVNGRDLNILREKANEVLKIIRSVHGATETAIEQEGPQSQLLIEVDREAAARFGINVQEINNLIELAVGGRAISTVYEGERRFDIALRYTREERDSVGAISGILILTRTGMKIPLSQVASVRMADGQTIISRENGKRQISVRTNIRGRDQGSFVEEARAKVAKSVRLPQYYSIEWGGQYENLARARKRLMMVIPVTVGLIYLILFFLFDRNPRYAAIVMTNVPFALVGGIFAIALRGINFSVSAGVGFVSLFGVAVMSGVLLISYINFLRNEKMMDLQEAVIRGSITQFRPVMMMMMVALIGLIPAAMAKGVGSDIQRPLATVIVGGLLSALLLTLTAMPAIYYVIEKKHREKMASKSRITE